MAECMAACTAASSNPPSLSMSSMSHTAAKLGRACGLLAKQYFSSACTRMDKPDASHW